MGKAFGAEIGKVLTNSRGSFWFSVSHLCLVLVLFSVVSFLLLSNMKSLDTVI